jgi:hypothetical protein
MSPSCAFAALRRPASLFLPLVAALAAAQPPELGTSRQFSEPPQRSTDAARTDPELRHMAACLIQRQPSGTRNLLAMIPGSPVEQRTMSGYESQLNQCVSYTERGIGFGWQLLRGAIAEIYYHQDFPAGLHPLRPISRRRRRTHGRMRVSSMGA